jgi:hypothetical protein
LVHQFERLDVSQLVAETGDSLFLPQQFNSLAPADDNQIYAWLLSVKPSP